MYVLKQKYVPKTYFYTVEENIVPYLIWVRDI